LTIADHSAGDYYEDAEGNQKYDTEAVQRSKLRIETRKWIMGRLAAKRYGDKVDVAVAVTVEDISDAELEARTRARLEALGVEVTGPLLIAMDTKKAPDADGAA
jgi:hypothetical protein